MYAMMTFTAPLCPVSPLAPVGEIFKKGSIQIEMRICGENVLLHLLLHN